MARPRPALERLKERYKSLCARYKSVQWCGSPGDYALQLLTDDWNYETAIQNKPVTGLYILFWPNGNIRTKTHISSFLRDGEFELLSHRTHGPCSYYYRGNGQILRLEYCHGAIGQHRIGKPAVYIFNNQGKVRAVEYWENGNWHREDGPAVITFDREGNPTKQSWFIKGVRVNAKIVLHPEKLTIDEIKSDNAEVQRTAIERFGWMKYLEAVDAKVIDRWQNEITGTNECLMECSVYDGDDDIDFDDSTARILVCACPSTARVYSIEVPPRTKNCRDAQKWLIGERLRKIQIIGAS